MRFLALAVAVAVFPTIVQAQARVADSVVTPLAPPADMRGLVPGQRVHVRAFLGDCRHAIVARGDVAGWSGDTMTVTLEQRGMTRPGEQLGIPIATILQLHVSLGRSEGQSRFALARGERERWVEVKRPRDVKHERSCPATVPTPIGTTRMVIP